MHSPEPYLAGTYYQLSLNVFLYLELSPTWVNNCYHRLKTLEGEQFHSLKTFLGEQLPYSLTSISVNHSQCRKIVHQNYNKIILCFLMRKSLARLLSSTYVSLTLTKFCYIPFSFLVGVVDNHMLYTHLIIDFGRCYMYSTNYAMFACFFLQVFSFQTCTDHYRVFWQKVNSKLRPHTWTAAFWLNLKE